MEEEKSNLPPQLKRTHSSSIQIFVPAFGDCFYISIAISYLLSAIHNIPEFDSRLDKLAKLSSEQKISLASLLLKNHNNTNFLNVNPLFNDVIRQFKKRLNTDNWGGTVKDTKQVEELLRIKIIELMEDIEEYSSETEEPADTIYVFILRCKPAPQELCSHSDDLLMEQGKIVSAEISGQQRHFRVIDANDRIRDALDIAALNEAEENHQRPLKKLRLSAEEVLSSTDSPDANSQPTQGNVTVSFQNYLYYFQAVLNQQLSHFVATTLKDTDDLYAIDWTILINLLKQNFLERLAFVQNYLSNPGDNSQDENDPDASDRKYALYSRLVFMGVLCALNDELNDAIQHFLNATAMPFYGSYELPHLWIVAIYFKQGKYKEVISYLNARRKKISEARTACELSEDQNINPINYISPLYAYFTQLGDTVHQLLFLQFTHWHYPEAEFKFFEVAATQKLGGAISQVPEFYSARADACIVQTAYSEALINYNKYPENANPLFMKAYCLMMLGQFEEAKPFFEKAIDAEANPSKKLLYLNFYIDILYEVHEKSASRLFRDDARDIMSSDTLSPIEKAKFILLNLKMLFSDSQPRFDRIFKEMQAFLTTYKQLSYKERDQVKLIVPFFKLCQRYARRFLDENKPEHTSKIVTFIIEKYNALVANLKEHLQDTSGEWWASGLLQFPNWCFDRGFISIHYAFILFCGKLSLSLSPDNPLLVLLDQTLETVSSHFKGRHISTGGDSGNNMAELLLSLDFYCSVMRENNPLRPTFQKTLSALKEQFPEDAAHVKTAVKSMVDENGSWDFSDLMQMTFEEVLERSNAEVQFRIIKYRVWSHNFLDFIEQARSTFFNFPPEFILIRMRHCIFELSLNPHRLDYGLVISQQLYNDLDAYIAYTKNLIPPLQRYYFTKHLGLFLTKNLLSSVKHFLDFLNIFPLLPSNERLARLGIVHHFLTQVEKFVAEFKTSERRYKKLSFLIEQCRREFENMIAEIDKTSLQKALEQAVNSYARDPLDVMYGKKPYCVPFPRAAIVSKLKNYQATQQIRSSANLSSHVLTLVFSTEPYQQGNQNTKTSIPIEINVPDDNGDVVGSEKSAGRDDILHRIQQGWEISRVPSLRTLFPIERPNSFSPSTHSHSEQHFFSYINKHAAKVFQQILERLPRGAKIYMTAFDIGSTRTSCQCCRLSALAAQSAKNEFTDKLQSFLLKHGFEIAGNKAESGRKLKSTTRVLAQKDYEPDGEFKHINPEERNVKYLNNLGIFQSKEPCVFISGQQQNARKEFNK